MKVNFRKRLKVLPGVYANISKSGVSWSVGARGATVNFGKSTSGATPAPYRPSIIGMLAASLVAWFLWTFLGMVAAMGLLFALGGPDKAPQWVMGAGIVLSQAIGIGMAVRAARRYRLSNFQPK